jgi:transcriptional regulator with XRE-family HTH domain|tara:strand:- start:44 stop:313 length:270 start_codon:yes stop_codon:yes gene_type:complete
MKPPIPDHWSRILLEIRKDSNITRVDLATYSGIGESTIENYEKRKIVEPSIYKVETLLAAMGYDLDALLVVPGEKDFTVVRKRKTNSDL